MIRAVDPWFERRVIESDITFLTEPHVHPAIRCNIWHLRGRTGSVVIDAGLGVTSLRRAAPDLFGPKIVCVATHSHFDHVGGIHEFDERWIHQAESRQLADAADGMALSVTALGSDLTRRMRESGYTFDEDSLLYALPATGFEPLKHILQGCAPTRELCEGDVVDTGNRTLEVLHLPGHSPGSIGLYDRTAQVLFSGDAIYDGPLLANLPESNLLDYTRTLERLLTLPVRVVYPGHGPALGPERLREIALGYLDEWKEGSGPPCQSAPHPASGNSR